MVNYGAVKPEDEEVAQDNISLTLVKLQELIKYQAERLAQLEKRISPILLPPPDTKAVLADKTYVETSGLRQELETTCNALQSNTDYMLDIMHRVDL